MRGLLVAMSLATGCVASGTAQRGEHCAAPSAAAPTAAFGLARGPFVEPRVNPMHEPPRVWLAAQRDVIVKGQSPRVFLFSADREADEYRKLTDFELQGPPQSLTERRCNPSWQWQTSDAVAVLDFECRRPASEGLFTVGVAPAVAGLEGSRVELPLRVLAEVPPPAPPPEGWEVQPLAAGAPHACELSGAPFEVHAEAGGVRLERYRPRQLPLPELVAARMSAEHARWVRFVFEDPDGWIVMSDLGEFGGGVEWFARGRGKPRSVPIENPGDERTSQNVRRAMVMDGLIYVLQGLTHGTGSRGQLAVLWREHGHFASRVIARYHSQPMDWLLQSDGSWLVLTHAAIWHTSRAGQLELVAQLPRVLPYLTSLARDNEGRLYAAGQNGVLRLTPRWPEAPRYSADLLLPQGSAQARCWADWVRAGRPDAPPE